jgi:L-fucose isomerase-like protein
MSIVNQKIKIGFIPANRGFFSSELAAKMRKQTILAMEKQGIEVVVPGEDQTKVGCVQSLAEAEICARLFRDNEIRGILVGAVNFGEEQSVAWTIRKAGLDVPVMIFGCQEEETLTMKTPRRDSFCGLLSIGDVLRQTGVKYTVARRPICFPSDASFAADLDWFVRVCRVVVGVKNARYAQIGTRPDAFWTCRFSEKQLQRLGPTTVVLDLSEAFAAANALADDDPDVRRLVEATRQYADCTGVTPESLLRSAKFELVLRRFQEANAIDAFGIQCWTSIQANYGVCACTSMSRLGDEGAPCACEADILGTMSMHAAMLASGRPAGLADWNNLHNEDDELATIWHCGVFPASFAGARPKLGVQEIIASSGAATYETSQGTVEFVAEPSPLTLARVTQDPEGGWHAVVAEGAFEENRAVTFGGYGWCRIPNLQRLYREVLLQHFPHHVGMTQTHVGNVLWEAFGNYLGMNVYHATQETPGLYTTRLPF